MKLLYNTSKTTYLGKSKQSVHPNLNEFNEIVKVKFRTEKYIASENHTEGKCQARWQPYV